MRSLWIGGIIVLGLLGAGCSSGNGATTTTTKGHSATATTAGKGPIKPTAKDKKACTAFNGLKADAKPTAAEIRTALDAVLKAGHGQLRSAGKVWAVALVHKSKTAAAHDQARIAAICTRMGLSAS
jgi:hypothetical protein